MLKQIDVDMRPVVAGGVRTWVASSDMFPGLQVIDDSLEGLEESLAMAVPVFLKACGVPFDPSGLVIRARYVRCFEGAALV